MKIMFIKYKILKKLYFNYNKYNILQSSSTPTNKVNQIFILESILFQFSFSSAIHKKYSSYH